jgi:hypothetical protein
MSKPLISLLHTTARLPDGWIEATIQWCKLANRPENIEYILFADGPEPGPQADLLPLLFHESSKVINGTGEYCAVGSANGWNRAAAASTGEILITISDDYLPVEKGWDMEVLRAFTFLDLKKRNTRGEYVLDVDNQDGAPHIPFSFLSRHYYEKLGYIFHPDYRGLMADLDFTEEALEHGVVIPAKHIKFKHLHYLCGTAPNDEVYQAQQQTMRHGQEVYARRQAERAERRSRIEVSA